MTTAPIRSDSPLTADAVGIGSTTLFCVHYVAPDGTESKWDGVSDFDKLKRDEIAKDRERRKGSWFARQAGKGHFRI
jgi:hypothetical protein